VYCVIHSRVDLTQGTDRIVLEHFPNIRRVECYVTIFPATLSEGWIPYSRLSELFFRLQQEFQPLSALRNLEKLTLTMAEPIHSTDDGVTEVIQAARKALAACPRRNKCLEVIFMGAENRTETFDYQ
jgi:hypothetical protein